MTLQSDRQAVLYGLGAVILWATVATAFKLALAGLSPIQLLFIASLTSVATLTLYLGCKGKLGLLKGQFLRRPLLYLQTGLLNPFLYYLVLFKAYDLLPAQQALSLNYTWAILLPILSVPLLKQKLTKTDLLAAFIAYSGVIIIATQGDPLSLSFDSPIGIGLALLSTLFWCLYWIINTKDNGDPVVSLLLSFIVGLPLVSLVMLIQGDWPAWSPKALAAGVYVGLFEMGATFILWLMALKTASHTAKVSTLVFLSPVLSIGFIATILGETIASSTFIGLALILSALMLQQLCPKLIAKYGEKVQTTK